MIALGLPGALALGALADLAAGAVRRALGGDRRWWAPVAGVAADFRRLGSRREGPVFLEAVGAGGALFGAGLAAAALVGLAPDSGMLLYLALLLAVTGGHLAVSVPTTRAGVDRTARARVQAAVAEPAFLLAVGAGFLRWRGEGLDAIRGAQDVLGPGFTVGPPAAATGVVLAVVVVLVAGSARFPPAAETRRGPGRGAGSAILARLARWAGIGASVLLAATLAAGTTLPPDSLLEGRFLGWVGAALGAAILFGAADAARETVGGRGRALGTVGATVLAALAVALVGIG